MPSPVKPSEFCSAVPSATSSLCDRIQAVFLRVPRLLCTFFEWMVNEDGTLTDNFIREVAAFPVGMMMPRMSSVVPAGWLACNGQEVSRETYAQLFAVIGTKSGVGNGTTTFNLPNGIKRVLMGYDPADAAYEIGATGGAARVTLLVTELPAHSHPFTPEVSTDATPASLVRLAAGNSGNTIGDGSYTTDNAGGGASHENQPPFFCGQWLIRY